MGSGGRTTTAKQAAFQAPPSSPAASGQQAAKAATTAGTLEEMGGAAGANQASPKLPSPGVHSTKVLNQTRNSPVAPAKMAVGGFAVVLGIAYFTLYSNKKPEATALDVAKVTTGTASPQNTRPRT